MLEFFDLLALLQDLDEVAPDDVNGKTARRHLQLDRMQAKLLDRPGPADAAITHEGDRLAVPFGIGVVERVLQHRRRSAIVFGRDHDEAVELRHLLLPAQRHLVFRGRPERRGGLVEEGHRIVAQVDHLDIEIAACFCYAGDPFRRLVGETGGAGRADDHADLGFGHLQSPMKL